MTRFSTPQIPATNNNNDEPLRVHQVAMYDSAQWEAVTTKLTLVLFPRPLLSHNVMRRGMEWEVRLRVKTRDLSRLMREGFHWDLKNFCPEATYFETSLQEEHLLSIGWTCSRNYYLSDLSDNPYWAAKLIVCARDMGMLSRFRVADLRPHMVSQAFAWERKQERRDFYNYELQHPESNFNSIYNDMPLEGWWPWPKKKQDSEKTEDSPAL